MSLGLGRHGPFDIPPQFLEIALPRQTTAVVPNLSLFLEADQCSQPKFDSLALGLGAGITMLVRMAASL